MDTFTLEARATVNAILVEFDRPSAAAQLRARYNPEAEVLELASDARPYPYGVNVGGLVVIDVDCARRVGNVEVMLPRRFWEVREGVALPPTSLRVVLTVHEATLRQKDFDLPVRVTTSKDRRFVRVAFGPEPEGLRFVGLSSSTVALIESSGALVGFAAMLPARN